jgi:outer membrane protein
MKNKLLFLLSVIFLPVISLGQATDLSLSSAISIALENNYGIKIAESGTQIASVNNSWGNAGRLPTIGFTANSLNSSGLVNNTSTSSRLTSGLALKWTIFDGFRVNFTKDKLSLLEDLSSGNGAVVVENTIEDIILAYYDVLLQKERLNVLEIVMQLTKDRYDYELIRQEIGKSLTYNVLLAKNNYLLDKAAVLNQDVTVRNSVRNLNFLLGKEPTDIWTFTEVFDPSTTDYALNDLKEKMLSDNTVLKNQYINLMISKNETKIKQGDYYPFLNLSTGLDNSNTLTGTDPGFANGTVTGYANLAFSFDIYQAGSRKRAVEIAKINNEIADIQTDQIVHSLTNQLFSFHDFYTVRKELYIIAGEALDAAELNMKISGEKFHAGVINSFNYRDVQLIYLNSALQRLQTIYNLIGSNTALTRLTGGFITPGQ